MPYALISIPLPINVFVNKFKGIKYVWISRYIGMLTPPPPPDKQFENAFFKKMCHHFSGNQKICLRMHKVTESTVFSHMSYWSFNRHNNSPHMYPSYFIYFLNLLALKKEKKHGNKCLISCHPLSYIKIICTEESSLLTKPWKLLLS